MIQDNACWYCLLLYVIPIPWHLHFHAFLYKSSVLFSFVMILNISAQMSPDDLWPHARHYHHSVVWVYDWLVYCWNVHVLMWCMMATVHIPLLPLLLLLLSKNHMTVFPFFTGLMTLNVPNSKRNQRAFKIFLYYHDNNNDNDDISVMFLIYPTTAALKYIKMWKYVKCFFLY